MKPGKLVTCHNILHFEILQYNHSFSPTAQHDGAAECDRHGQDLVSGQWGPVDQRCGLLLQLDPNLRNAL